MLSKSSRRPHCGTEIRYDSREVVRDFVVRDRHLDGVGVFYMKYRCLMRRSLEKGLSDHLPPPILAHTNHDTVPPTITLGITFLEL
eukprot:10828888-Prorocentrum_lima.AAC.1